MEGTKKMINKNVEEALNSQLNKEVHSSYLYLQMASYFSEKNLDGFANWMKVQAQEEHFHAMKFFDYIINRGGKVVLDSIEKPESEYESILDVFEKTLNHEVYVTSQINEVYQIAENEKDRATLSFLKWFIDEQVEEESTVENIIANIKLVGCSSDAIFMMDREMANRVFTEPTA